MFTAESTGERILNYGQHLVKLWARIGVPVLFVLFLFFLTHVVYFKWCLLEHL